MGGYRPGTSYKLFAEGVQYSDFKEKLKDPSFTLQELFALANMSILEEDEEGQKEEVGAFDVILEKLQSADPANRGHLYWHQWLSGLQEQAQCNLQARFAHCASSTGTTWKASPDVVKTGWFGL